MFLLNSRSHLVSAAASRSSRKDLHHQRRTFSRSYGTILPSSFTRVLSRALVFSTCLPVSVCGTVRYEICLVTFPGSRASAPSSLKETPHRFSALTSSRICLRALPTSLNQNYQSLAHLAFSVITSLSYQVREY